MKKYCITLIFIFCACMVKAQGFHIGVFGGLAAYNGDLVEKIFPKKVTNGAIGLTVSFEISDQIMLRAGGTYAVIGGIDRLSDNVDARARNLSFETSITEFSLLGEYYLLNLNEKIYSPYLFAGAAVFQFNPYVYTGSKQKIFLNPLGTEGQGLAGYPDRKPYNLTQLAIPFGGGIKLAVTDQLRIGFEGGLRKLFTDYLDDVSTNYIDETDLLTGKGQLAVDISYRGDEVAGGSLIYPVKGYQRGSPKRKDIYYFAGIHLTYKLGGGGGGLTGSKNRTGCPVNVY
ncbi:MAG: hypothetical protein IPO53_09870 [Chitinophagaceae bacterium]|nr:hypothetical protein [Chitinophagaceae bacterium]